MEQDAPFHQPDFRLAADHIREAASQLERCANIPAVNGGVAILQRLDAVIEQLALLTRKVDALDRKHGTADRNFRARLANSIVIMGEMPLEPLYHPETGDVIQNCPLTLAELEGLGVRETGDLLRQLGENVPRAEAARKRQLKIAFGVRTQII